jgi:hypothetical protein
MRRLLALLVLAAVTAPSLAGGYGFYRGHRVGFRGYDRSDPHAIHARVARFHQFFGHSGRSYWHHPYYLRRFGGMRPYQFYRTGGYGYWS